MSNRPKPWLAALLAFFFHPLGFLYVGCWKWALAVMVALFGLAGLQFTLVNTQSWLPTIAKLIFGGVLARLAYLQARGFEADRVRPPYSRWYGLWPAALLIVALILGVRAFLFEPFRVPSGSMQPTLGVGARLIAQKWGYGNYATLGIGRMRKPISASVERGDIFVFEFPSNRELTYVSRVIGLPGDKIEYRNKALFINGQELNRRVIDDYFDESKMGYYSQFIEKLDKAEYTIWLDKSRPATISGTQGFPYSENCTYSADGVACLVPPGHYYVSGDNRDNSFDSRYWGFVAQDHLIGKVVRVFP